MSEPLEIDEPTEDLEKEISEQPTDACSTVLRLFPDTLYEVTSTSTVYKIQLENL